MTACPTPDKTEHPTELAARRAAAVRMHDQRAGVKIDVYPCSCGAWHLTSGGGLSEKVRRALAPDETRARTTYRRRSR